MRNSNTNHINVTLNLIQSLFKFNKLDNGNICQGLLRRFVHKITNNNEISPHNDINKKILRLKPQNDVINKNVTNLFPYFPISLSLKKKVDSSLPLRMTAFTLAETLITLGIIGVVAAITIPGLINHYKAQRLRTQFLEAYSIVQQVFKQMETDDVSLDPTTYPTGKFYKTFMKYLKGATDCNRKKFLPCYYFNADDKDENFAPYKSLDGKTNVPGNIFDDGQIALNNGMLIMFENYSNDYTGGDANRLWVSVDINGYNNPPNRLGYDLFTFQFLDGELRTMGSNGTAYTNMNAYCNPKTTNPSNGIACASKAKTDTDYFKILVKTVK